MDSTGWTGLVASEWSTPLRSAKDPEPPVEAGHESHVGSARVLSSRLNLEPDDCLTFALTAHAVLWGVTPEVVARWVGLPRSLCRTVRRFSPLSAEAITTAARRFGAHESVLRLAEPARWAHVQPLRSAAPGFRPEVTRARIRHSAVPVCPECTRERPWAVPFINRFPVVPACLEHGRVFVTYCADARCRSPLRDASRSIRLEPACPACRRPIRVEDSPRIDSVRGLSRALETCTQQISAEREAGADAPRGVDLAALSDAVLLLSRKPQRNSALQGWRRVTAYEVAEVLPMALQMLECGARCLTAQDRGRLGAIDDEVAMRFRLGLLGSGSLKVMALLGRASRDRYSPRYVLATMVGKRLSRLSPDGWPRTLPDEIFRLGLADLVHDTYAHLGHEPPDWEDAKSAGAILVAAASFNESLPASARRLSRGPAALGVASHVVDSAGSLGLREELEAVVAESASILATVLVRAHDPRVPAPELAHELLREAGASRAEGQEAQRVGTMQDSRSTA